MKKLMIAASAALCAAVSMAVESANVVGYATRDINNKFKMAAAQFETVTGETVSLNGAVTLPSSVAVQCWDDDYESYDYKDGWMDSAPQIQVPKVGAVGYNYYYFISDCRSTIDDSNVGLGWADSSGYLTSDAVPAGFGIWVRGYVNGTEDVDDTTFTFNGAVCGDATQTVQCENMFKLRALPYPVSASLNDNIANWSALTPVQCWDDDYESYDYKDGWMDSAPQIQVPKAGGGYDYYYYITDCRSTIDDSNLGTGWADSSGYRATEKIPVAYGIWINARTSESVNIPFNM